MLFCLKKKLIIQLLLIAFLKATFMNELNMKGWMDEQIIFVFTVFHNFPQSYVIWSYDVYLYG